MNVLILFFIITKVIVTWKGEKYILLLIGQNKKWTLAKLINETKRGPIKLLGYYYTILWRKEYFLQFDPPRTYIFHYMLFFYTRILEQYQIMHESFFLMQHGHGQLDLINLINHKNNTLNYIYIYEWLLYYLLLEIYICKEWWYPN